MAWLATSAGPYCGVFAVVIEREQIILRTQGADGVSPGPGPATVVAAPPERSGAQGARRGVFGVFAHG